MKKIISILLTFVLCFSGINYTVFAEEQSTGKIYIESVIGKVDETINVPIIIKDNPGIISLITEISYDNTALKLISVNKNDEFWKSANMTSSGDLSAQPYRIIWYDGLAKNDFKENGILAILSFKVLKTGSHEIQLSVSNKDTFNNSFVKIPFDIGNGVIEIPSESTATTSTLNKTTLTTSNVTTAYTTITTAITNIELKNGRLELNNAVGTVGETVNIPLTIKDNPGIISLIADISYDNTALKLESINKNNDFWQSATMTPSGDINAQPYRIIWYDGLTNNDFIENGMLAELSFKVLKTGTHKIKLSVSEADTFNNSFEKVHFEVEDGIAEVITTTTPKSFTTTTKNPTTTTTSHKSITTTLTSTMSLTTSTTTNNPFHLKETDISLNNGDQYSISLSLKDVTYKSSNNNVAVVSSKGIITAISIGEAIISIIDKDYNVIQLHVRVNAKSDEIGSISFKLGDINSDEQINSVDASSVLAYYARISTNQEGGYDEKQILAADVNNDGSINSVDASKILAYYAYVSTTKEEILSIEEYLKK